MKSLRLAVTSTIAVALALPLFGARPLNSEEWAVVAAIQEEASYASKYAEICLVFRSHLNERAILSELMNREVKVKWGPCITPAHFLQNQITIERIKEPIPGTYDILLELSEISVGKKIGIRSREGTYEVRVRTDSEPEIIEYRPADALDQGGHVQ